MLLICSKSRSKTKQKPEAKQAQVVSMTSGGAAGERGAQGPRLTAESVSMNRTASKCFPVSSKAFQGKLVIISCSERTSSRCQERGRKSPRGILVLGECSVALVREGHPGLSALRRTVPSTQPEPGDSDLLPRLLGTLGTARAGSGPRSFLRGKGPTGRLLAVRGDSARP